MTSSWRFKANLVMLAALGIVPLAGCSDDTLAERKKACTDYVNYGVLQDDEKQQCVADEQTFRRAANALVATDLREMSTDLTVDAAEISASRSKADLTAFVALPASIGNQLIFDNTDEIAKRLPASVDLVRVTFGAPSNANRQWQISGYRAGQPDDVWVLNLDGFGPTQASRIENNCGLFAYSSFGNGCRARVYIKAISPIDPDLKEMVAVAVDLKPPSGDEAYQALLANEMSRWQSMDRKQ